jgi:hypothetical protein
MPGSNPAEVEIFVTTKSMYVFEGGCLRTEGRRVSKDKICLIGKEENMTGGEITKLANSGKQLLKAPSQVHIDSFCVRAMQCNEIRPAFKFAGSHFVEFPATFSRNGSLL